MREQSVLSGEARERGRQWDKVERKESRERGRAGAEWSWASAFLLTLNSGDKLMTAIHCVLEVDMKQQISLPGIPPSHYAHTSSLKTMNAEFSHLARHDT